MIPVYEQGCGRGIGLDRQSFQNRIEQIIKNKMSEGEEKAFALIFYDFRDKNLRRILKDDDVFTKLDRLSGRELSIFYLHSGSDEFIKSFNKQFIKKLKIVGDVNLPCVVFFRTSEKGLVDISIASIYSDKITHGFQELYEIIRSYVSDNPLQAKPKNINWIKSSIKFLSLESMRVLISEFLKNLAI